MTRNNNSSSNDVSTVNAWFKPTCQLKEQIVFILQTISMSLSSSACHVAFRHLVWLAIPSSYSRRHCYCRWCGGKARFCCHRNRQWLLPANDLTAASWNGVEVPSPQPITIPELKVDWNPPIECESWCKPLNQFLVSLTGEKKKDFDRQTPSLGFFFLAPLDKSLLLMNLAAKCLLHQNHTLSLKLRLNESKTANQ